MSRARFSIVVVVACVGLATAPAAAETQVRWSRPVGAEMGGVASGSGGGVVVVGSTDTGPGGAMLVRSFNEAGGVLWSRTWRPVKDGWTYGTGVDTGRGHGVFASGVLWTPLDLDAPTSWFIRAYTREGRLLWSRLARGWREQSASAGSGGIDAWRDGVALSGGTCGEGGCYGGWVRSYALDGSLRWVRSVGAIHGFARDVALTPTGAAYVTGAFNASSGPIGEGDHAFVTKLRPDGSKVWTYRFSGAEGSGRSIAIRRGGVVMSGQTSGGARTWLSSLHGDGSVWWTRTLRRGLIADVDVAPGGRIWVTGRAHLRDGKAALFVRVYRPDGRLLQIWWRNPEVAAAGTSIGVDRLGVSVGGWRGDAGRVWRLSV
jgi:hypothetical protein